MADLPPVLRPLCERPAEAALFVDFDGTLAPIVDDPAAARPLTGRPRSWPRLARRFGLVAVVSGRPVAFLLEALGHPPGVAMAGLYGMEAAAAGGAVVTRPEAAALAAGGGRGDPPGRGRGAARAPRWSPRG